MATQFAMQGPGEISDAELDRIARLAEAAAAGPWTSFVVGRDMEAGLNCIELGTATVMEILGGSVADQDFIASAREDLPRLVFEVRTLRARLNFLLMQRSGPATSTSSS
jgi:hypothetical protein